MKKDHLFKILETLTEKEKKDFKLQIETAYKGKIPYFFHLYKQYEKLLSKAASDIEIETTFHKFFNRNPKLYKDIANIRKQLKEKILFFLVKTQKTTNAEQKVLKDIKIIELLVNRSLYEEALLAINRTKKIAQQHDLSKALIDITDLHLVIISMKGGEKDLVIQQKLVKEFNYYLSIYSLELTLKNVLRQQNLILQNDFQLRKEESQKVFLKVSKQFDLDNFEIAHYKKNKHTHIVSLYYRILNIYHRVAGNFTKAFNSSKMLIEYFESDVSLITKFEPKYIKSICSFTRACYGVNAFEALEESIEKVKCLYEKGTNHTALEATCDIGVLHYLHTQQYAKAYEMVSFMEKEWENISSKTIHSKLHWYCHSNLLLFWITNHQTKFEYWLNNGLNIPCSSRGKDFYYGIRMFELIHDFEQDNWLHFFHKVETLQKTLRNNDNLTAFEQTVLLHVRKLYHNGQDVKKDNNEKTIIRKETFQSLKSALKAFEFNNPPINYNEILLWCESQLQNKTIQEVFEADYLV